MYEILLLFVQFLWSLTSISSGSDKKLSLVLLQISNSLENVQKNVIWLDLFWYKVFVQWKLILLSFLMDSILIFFSFSLWIINKFLN